MAVSLPSLSAKWLSASKDLAMGAFGTVVSSQETKFWGKLLRGQLAPPRPLHRNYSHASWAAGGLGVQNSSNSMTCEP